MYVCYIVGIQFSRGSTTNLSLRLFRNSQSAVANEPEWHEWVRIIVRTSQDRQSGVWLLSADEKLRMLDAAIDRLNVQI